MLNLIAPKAIPVGFPNPSGPPSPNRYPDFGGISMKTQLAVSTFALIVGLSGITPAVADSSSASAHSSPSHQGGAGGATHGVGDGSGHSNSNNSFQSRAYGSEGKFTRSWSQEIPTRSWNQGVTPSRSEGPQSSSARPTTGESCSQRPRFGFNDANNFPTC
jgi:hypothetical protein